MSKELMEFLEEWGNGGKDLKIHSIEFTEREIESILLATKLLYKQIGSDDAFEIEQSYLKTVIEKVSKKIDPNYKFEEDRNMALKIFSHEKNNN